MGLGWHDVHPLPAAAALAALGIVYGDIGTSPLYALKQAAVAGGTLSSETVIGIVSLILWTLILIVSFKYAILIMRADNHREAASSRCWRSWMSGMRQPRAGAPPS